MTEQTPRTTGTQRCTNGTCVDAKLTGDGVVVTSTIDGNDGRVVFTHAEWDAFLNAVKDRAWDHTYSRHLAAAPV